MPPRVLITGVTGFAGSHLAERFVALGADVHGFAFEDAPHPNLAAVADRVTMHRGDITSLEDLRGAMARSRAEVVVHLAGQAVPTLAARDPIGAVRVNVLGTAAVLAAVDERPGVRVVLASSGDVYGAPARSPVTEDAPLDPRNPYAATKVAAEALARELGKRDSRPVVILRPTNHVGPRQHPGLVASSFAKQIAQAEAGLAPAVVRHGSLEARRDFLDVRDMAEAYVAACEIAEPGAHVFNVGTGRAVGIGEILSTLVELARVPLTTEVDPERVRRGDASAFALDASRFRARTGWSPRIPLRTSLGDLLDYWRAQVGQAELNERAASPRGVDP
ncbi:MAG TPA: GDP-mannose 4,6-dehydratase [Candidatus Limnocylindria bacterium]|nr:GDP-mannose 4,6-dehydratase [Candidatus Limnocylindria bacterium]